MRWGNTLACSAGRTDLISKSRSPCMSRKVDEMKSRILRHPCWEIGPKGPGMFSSSGRRDGACVFPGGGGILNSLSSCPTCSRRREAPCSAMNFRIPSVQPESVTSLGFKFGDLPKKEAVTKHRNRCLESGVVAYICNPSTCPGRQEDIKFKPSQGYIPRLYSAVP